MSIVVGGQLPESWANDDSQCEKGRGIAGGGGDFDGFVCESDILVFLLSPSAHLQREMVIRGKTLE